MNLIYIILYWVTTEETPDQRIILSYFSQEVKLVYKARAWEPPLKVTKEDHHHHQDIAATCCFWNRASGFQRKTDSVTSQTGSASNAHERYHPAGHWAKIVTGPVLDELSFLRHWTEIVNRQIPDEHDTRPLDRNRQPEPQITRDGTTAADSTTVLSSSITHNSWIHTWKTSRCLWLLVLLSFSLR